MSCSLDAWPFLAPFIQKFPSITESSIQVHLTYRSVRDQKVLLIWFISVNLQFCFRTLSSDHWSPHHFLFSSCRFGSSFLSGTESLILLKRWPSEVIYSRSCFFSILVFRLKKATDDWQSLTVWPATSELRIIWPDSSTLRIWRTIDQWPHRLRLSWLILNFSWVYNLSYPSNEYIVYYINPKMIMVKDDWLK